MRLTEAAPAKINLALHVRARRDDGYHVLETLFAFADIGDQLTAEPSDALSLQCVGPFGDALNDEPDNLVLRAARALQQASGTTRGAALILTKNLPIASGIGGGSADAAAALRILNRLWNAGLDEQALCALAAPLGADIPACVLSRTCRGEGVGDALEPVSSSSVTHMPVVLVNPGVAVETGPVFAAWDQHDRGALPTGDPMSVALGGRNDLQAPAISVAPAIADVLRALEAQSPHLARMSGSGATCFALFGDNAERDAACAAIRTSYPDWWCEAGRLL